MMLGEMFFKAPVLCPVSDITVGKDITSTAILPVATFGVGYLIRHRADLSAEIR